MIDNKIQESISLDYKASASLRRDPMAIAELTKDVSAFANSAGGTIIYGVKEDLTDKRFPGGIDDGLDPGAITREWIEQILNSRIQRRIDGLRIKPIGLSGAKSGKVIYAVSIPQSARAPHQADDKKFYKRYNFQSVPMEEYEVRDAFGRQEAPDLSVSLFLEEQPYAHLVYVEPDYSQPIVVLGTITNHAATPAEYRVIQIFVDRRLRINRFPVNNGTSEDANALRVNDREIPVTSIQINGAIPGQIPVWKGPSYRLFEGQLNLSVPQKKSDYLIHWTVDSPRMERRAGTYHLRCDRQVARLVLVEGEAEPPAS